MREVRALYLISFQTVVGAVNYYEPYVGVSDTSAKYYKNNYNLGYISL
jgi:hypothetical protein